jgi:hypothetical protein
VKSLPSFFGVGPTIMKESVVFEIMEDVPPFRTAKFKMEGFGPAIQGADIPQLPGQLPGAFSPFSAFSATNADTHIDLGDFEGPASFVAGATEQATLKMEGNLFKMSLHTIPRRIPINGVKEGALSTSLDDELIEQP